MQTIPWLCRKSASDEVGQGEDGEENGHEGGGDHPVELVEQLQIRLVLEDETLHVHVQYLNLQFM